MEAFSHGVTMKWTLHFLVYWLFTSFSDGVYVFVCYQWNPEHQRIWTEILSRTHIPIPNRTTNSLPLTIYEFVLVNCTTHTLHYDAQIKSHKSTMFLRIIIILLSNFSWSKMFRNYSVQFLLPACLPTYPQWHEKCCYTYIIISFIHNENIFCFFVFFFCYNWFRSNDLMI